MCFGHELGREVHGSCGPMYVYESLGGAAETVGDIVVDLSLPPYAFILFITNPEH